MNSTHAFRGYIKKRKIKIHFVERVAINEKVRNYIIRNEMLFLACLQIRSFTQTASSVYISQFAFQTQLLPYVHLIVLFKRCFKVHLCLCARVASFVMGYHIEPVTMTRQNIRSVTKWCFSSKKPCTSTYFKEHLLDSLWHAKRDIDGAFSYLVIVFVLWVIKISSAKRPSYPMSSRPIVR